NRSAARYVAGKAKTRVKTFISFPALLLLTLAGFFPALAGAAESTGSPTEAFKAFYDAVKDKDYKAVNDLMAEQELKSGGVLDEKTPTFSELVRKRRREWPEKFFESRNEK